MATLLEQARQARRQTKLLGSPQARRARLAKPQVPRAVERAYFDYLRKVFAAMHSAIMLRVAPLLPAAIDRSRQLVDRADSAEVPLRELDAVRIELTNGVLTPDGLGQRIREFGQQTTTYQGSELQSQIKRGLGVQSPIMSDATIGPLLRDWISENVRLIKTIGSEHFGQIERLIASGTSSGRRHEEIRQQIVDRFGVTQRRAALIARDQVGKFYGQVTRARNRELGIKRYTWRTSLDERVRPEHVEREGKVYEWTDPPADGHPGYPINCRCTAEPILVDVLEQLEKEEAADRERLQALEKPEPEKPVELEKPPELPPLLKPIPTGNVGAEVVRDFPKVADAMGTSLHVDRMRSDQQRDHVADLEKVPAELLEAFRDSGGSFRLGPGAAYEVALKSKPPAAALDDRPRGYAAGKTRRDVPGWYSPRTSEIAIGDMAHGSTSVAVHELGHAVDAQVFGVTYKETPGYLAGRQNRLAAEYTARIQAAREAGRTEPTEREQRELAALELFNRDLRRKQDAFHREHAKWAKAEQRPGYYTQGYRYEYRWDPKIGGTKLAARKVGDIRDGINEAWAEIFGTYFGAGKAAAEEKFSPGMVKALEGVVAHASDWKPKASKRKPKESK